MEEMDFVGCLWQSCYEAIALYSAPGRGTWWHVRVCLSWINGRQCYRRFKMPFKERLGKLLYAYQNELHERCTWFPPLSLDPRYRLIVIRFCVPASSRRMAPKESVEHV